MFYSKYFMSEVFPNVSRFKSRQRYRWSWWWNIKKEKKHPPEEKLSQNKKKSPQTGIDRLLEFMAQTKKNEDERQKRHEEFIQKQNEEKLKRFDKLLDALLDK